MISENFTKLLEQYLKAYWLRPTTALIRTLESEILGLEKYKGTKTLELACGDGTNGHIAAGGMVADEFDVFKSLPLISAEDFFGGKTDLYDSFAETEDHIYKIQPTDFWTKGIDHKENLLKKAALIGSYNHLECRDLNTGLNEPADTYDLVFSNSIYWVENIEKILKDIFDCLKPGGVAKLSIIKNSFIDEMAWSKLKDYDFKKYVDMGRHQHYQQLVDEKTWESRFKKAGFDLVSKTPTFNRNLVHMVEFHDYREISPLTTFMANSLDERSLKKVKTYWMEYAQFTFEKMYAENFFLATPSDSYYHIYDLKKP